MRRFNAGQHIFQVLLPPLPFSRCAACLDRSVVAPRAYTHASHSSHARTAEQRGSAPLSATTRLSHLSTPHSHGASPPLPLPGGRPRRRLLRRHARLVRGACRAHRRDGRRRRAAQLGPGLYPHPLGVRMPHSTPPPMCNGRCASRPPAGPTAAASRASSRSSARATSLARRGSSRGGRSATPPSRAPRRPRCRGVVKATVLARPQRATTGSSDGT